MNSQNLIVNEWSITNFPFWTKLQIKWFFLTLCACRNLKFQLVSVLLGTEKGVYGKGQMCQQNRNRRTAWQIGRIPDKSQAKFARADEQTQRARANMGRNTRGQTFNCIVMFLNLRSVPHFALAKRVHFCHVVYIIFDCLSPLELELQTWLKTRRG